MADSRSGYSGPLPSMPNFRSGGLLRIVIAAVVVLLLLWSVTSIPTGNVGVLTSLAASPVRRSAKAFTSSIP